MKYENSEIESYNNYVLSLAQSDSDALISNGLQDHARILVTTLISHAKEQVRMFAALANPSIYEHRSTIDALQTFLNTKDTKLQILLQNCGRFNSLESLRSNEFLALCSEHLESGKCEIRRASLEDSDTPEHFLIMDSKGYRFCPNKGVPTAIATFNRPSVASNLVKQFNNLFSRSLPLEHIHQLSSSKAPALLVS